MTTILLGGGELYMRTVTSVPSSRLRMRIRHTAGNPHKMTTTTAVMMLGIIVMAIVACVMLLLPMSAYAATGDAYQLYDTRARTQQVTVNKVWDDGLSNDDRKSGSTSYQSLMSVSIMTGVPQSSIRTYSIKFDANGGNFGTDSSGNTITTNVLSYNAKNAVTSGTYAVPERSDGYTCIGWSTSSSATSADSTITSAVTNPSLTNKYLNSLTDKSTTTLYAVWKDCRIRYAVMMYGMYVDNDASGSTDTVTFGPALGYPEFSQYKENNGSYIQDMTVTPTMMRHHDVSGDATVMSEDADACTDSSHSVITGTDAGTDSSGNAYRCLHYDNWITILYWCKKDPHVYDKCMRKGCSKTVMISPTQASIQNGILSTSPGDSGTGDGNSYIVYSRAWDETWLADITKSGQGYAASRIRAELVGADLCTKADDDYAGADAMTRYTSSSCLFACFPRVLKNAIVAKNLSAVANAQYTYDVVSNDGVSDKLWLFSPYEMNYDSSHVVYSGNSITTGSSYNRTRSSKNWFWLRSPYYSDSAWLVNIGGGVYYNYVTGVGAVSPGFLLPAATQTSMEPA